MNEHTHKNDFLASLERCSSSEQFIPSFYSRFLASDSEIRKKFESVDFQRQNRMLLRSLELAAGATSGEPASLREIGERAESHDRHHLDIQESHYDLWLEAVVETASEYDELWSPEIEEAWRTILGFVIKHMISKY